MVSRGSPQSGQIAKSTAPVKVRVAMGAEEFPIPGPRMMNDIQFRLQCSAEDTLFVLTCGEMQVKDPLQFFPERRCIFMLPDLMETPVWQDLIPLMGRRHYYAATCGLWERPPLIGYWAVVVDQDQSPAVGEKEGEKWMERDHLDVARWKNASSRRRYRKKMVKKGKVVQEE